MKKGKKLTAGILAVLLAVTMVPAGICAEEKEEEKLTKVTLNEVAHSIFYAPQYVAIENGYFAEEGLDLTLVTGFGADKTMTAVLSGEADIGFMGAEASIYAYQEGANDPVVNFAQLTQRAGNFLVAREEMPSFTWENENQPVKQSRPVGFTMLIGFAASALPAAGAIVLPEELGRWLPAVVVVALLAGSLPLYRSCIAVRLRELN